MRGRILFRDMPQHRIVPGGFLEREFSKLGSDLLDVQNSDARFLLFGIPQGEIERAQHPAKTAGQRSAQAAVRIFGRNLCVQLDHEGADPVAHLSPKSTQVGDAGMYLTCGIIRFLREA